MSIPIFSDYGVEVFLDNGKYYIRYDTGEIVSEYITQEISEAEYEKVRIDERSAYSVIIELQNKSI